MSRAKIILISLIILLVLLPACGKSVTITPLAARKITHPTRGFEDCQSCHATGINGAVKNPDNHSAYTNKDCNICHKPQ